MKIAICKLKSMSPYSQSRPYSVERLSGELHDAYENRTWRERCNSDEKTGNVFIPPMSFVNAIKEAARYLSISIPGRGKSTFTKHFESGVMMYEPLILPDKKDTVYGEKVYVPSDGRRGGTTRVWKTFPVVREWEGKVTFYIMDDIITEDVFLRVLTTAGMLIGIGRFRPRNWGYYGRFRVEAIKWQTEQ